MRILFILISFLFCGKIEAQNLDSVRYLWQRNELGRALDLISKDTLSTTEAWLLKAKIYQSISVDAKYKDLVADPKKEAFDALKTAYASDLNSLITDSTAYKIYEGYTNDGVAFFNAGTEKQNKTDYVLALKSFRKAAEVRAFIADYISLPRLDTTNLYYSAKAAIYSKNDPESFFFAKRIAENGLNEPKFESIYQWLLYYCKEAGDEKVLDHYSYLADIAFPKSSYSYLTYIDFFRDRADVELLALSYNQLFEAKFDKPEYRLAYIKDLYNFSFNDSLKVKSWNPEFGVDSIKRILYTELSKFVKANPRSIEGKLLFGKFYINKAVDTQKEKPGANISSLLIKSNEYLKDVANRSPKADKNLKIEAVKLLIGNYTVLKQSKQVRLYQLKLKQLIK